MSSCRVVGCSRPIWVELAGLCSRHYNRLRRTGTVEDGPRARLPLEERFWKYVEVRNPDECWPWVGKTRVKGYGSIGVGGRKGRSMLAHRVSYILANGAIPDNPNEWHGTVIMHTCDNPSCCNPAHLKAGTQSDNVRDMIAKGRCAGAFPRGSKHPNSKLTEDDVTKILTSSLSGAEMARRLGVNRATVNRIRRGDGWSQIQKELK